MLASQIRLAARNLARHRTRTIISLSAIAFGVTSLLLAGGFIEWIFWAMRDQTIYSGLGHIQISRTGFRDAGLADPSAYLLPADGAELALVRAAPGVEVVGERLQLSGLASSGETTLAFIGEAVDPEADKVLSIELKVDGGRVMANDRSGVLLGRGLGDALGVKLGDPVTLLISVPGGGINAVEGRVVGLFTTGVKAYDDRAVRMPIALGRELLRVRGSHVWVVGLQAIDYDTAGTMAYLRARLAGNRFELATWLDLADFYRKSVVLLSRQIDVVALLIGLIIVLGISNTLAMNVLERTGEIGMLMALGTPRHGILRLFVIEGLLLGVFGGLAGLGFGFLLAQALSYVGIPMPPPPGRDVGFSAEIILTIPHVLTGFAMAVASATVASFYPAWKASRLPVVDALRHNR